MDVNECSLPNVCGPGSLCTNFPGGHHCECPEGYTGDAYGAGCHDVDECSRSPCGKDAQCHNNEGSFRCSCPPGFVGDPFHSCKGMRRSHAARLQIIILYIIYKTCNPSMINNLKPCAAYLLINIIFVLNQSPEQWTVLCKHQVNRVLEQKYTVCRPNAISLAKKNRRHMFAA